MKYKYFLSENTKIMERNKNFNNTQLRKIKIVLLGDSGVGKTTLNNHYITKQASEASENPTIGAIFYSKNMEKDGHRVKLDIWDTAGQERFHSLANMYCRGASGCLCVFDVTDYNSFKNIDRWIMRFENSGLNPNVIILVANKTDYNEDLWQVSREKITLFAESNKLPVAFVSGKTGDGIENLYNILMELIITNEIGLYQPETPHKTLNMLDDDFEDPGTSCFC